MNDWEIGFVVRQPPPLRPVFGWFKSKLQIAGCDVAGVVEPTGKDDQRFKLGDAVYGDIHVQDFSGHGPQTATISHAERKQAPLYRGRL